MLFSEFPHPPIDSFEGISFAQESWRGARGNFVLRARLFIQFLRGEGLEKDPPRPWQGEKWGIS